MGSSNDEEGHAFATQSQTWTLKDVANHVFHRVWTCGIPVHQRYVAALLNHSTAAHELELASEAACDAFLTEARRKALYSLRPDEDDTHAKSATATAAAAQRQVQLECWAREHVLRPVHKRAGEANAAIARRPGLRRASSKGHVADLTEVVALRLTTHAESGAAPSAETCCVVMVPLPMNTTIGDGNDPLIEALASVQPWESSDVATCEARDGAGLLTSSYWTSVEQAKVMEALLSGDKDVSRAAPRLRPGQQARPAKTSGALPKRSHNSDSDVVVVDVDDDDEEAQEVKKAVAPRVESVHSSQATPHERKSRRLEDFFPLSPSTGNGTVTSTAKKSSTAHVVVVTSDDDEDASGSRL